MRVQFVIRGFLLCGLLACSLTLWASDAHPVSKPEPKAETKAETKPDVTPDATAEPKPGDKFRALIQKMGKDGTIHVNVSKKGGKDGDGPAVEEHAPPKSAPKPAVKPPAARPPPAAKSAHGAHGTPSAHSGHARHWTYEGDTGPEQWASLAPENKLCQSGTRQSPIHIEDHDALAIDAMEPLTFDYRPSTGSVWNNGHTVQFDVYTDNQLTVRGNTYRLLQFHFHHPAEERINHKRLPLVAHLVHRSAEGQLAVVAVQFDVGDANSAVQTVWSNMPLEVNDRVRVTNGSLDLRSLLPADARYYQFFGSLTTPPCSEGVLWLVLKQPMTVSAQQLAVFAKLFPGNARPIQPLNGRIIKSAQ